MTGTDLCVNKSQFVPVIFEPPCTKISSCELFVSCCLRLQPGPAFCILFNVSYIKIILNVVVDFNAVENLYFL
jgi:hypothetical protein